MRISFSYTKYIIEIYHIIIYNMVSQTRAHFVLQSCINIYLFIIFKSEYLFTISTEIVLQPRHFFLIQSFQR